MCFKKNDDNKWKLDQATAIQTLIIIIVFVTTTIAAYYKTVNTFELSIQSLNLNNKSQDEKILKLEKKDDDFESRIWTMNKELSSIVRANNRR